jgi:hypothetical protein
MWQDATYQEDEESKGVKEKKARNQSLYGIENVHVARALVVAPSYDSWAMLFCKLPTSKTYNE